MSDPLSPDDIRSPTWHKIKKHLESRLEKLHIRNEEDLDPIETTGLRAEIRAIKGFLRMGEITKADEEPNY